MEETVWKVRGRGGGGGGGGEGEEEGRECIREPICIMLKDRLLMRKRNRQPCMYHDTWYVAQCT